MASEEDEEGYCFSAITDAASPELITWILDSGASEHLVNNVNLLSNMRSLSQPIKIRIAKSRIELKARHVGEIKGKIHVNGKQRIILIQNVLHVTGLQFNLLSVPKLEMKGYRILFEKGKGIILKNNKVVAVANRNYRVYELNIINYLHTANACTSVLDRGTWHRRLGHINFNSLEKLAGMVEGLNLSHLRAADNACSTCVEGKQTRLPHNQRRIRARRPLELVHSDLFGPINTESYNKKRYVLTFIDDFTHFTVAYPLERKSEVARYFKVYMAMIAAHHPHSRISRFRCDNGREYISAKFKTECERKGIRIEYTVPYTPQQNGVAERMNRTIIERARCLILNSRLSKRFWTEAVLTAVYLINRNPTEALKDKVPAELWYGNRPNLVKLRVLGCIAYLHVPRELNPGKFDSRSKKCFMLGYCDNGYKLWCPKENKILYGRDIVFDENRFEFHPTYVETTVPLDEEKENSEQEDVEQRDIPAQDAKQIYREEAQPEAEEEDTESEQEQQLRRSKRKARKPSYLTDYCAVALQAETVMDDLLQDFKDIETRNDKEEWYRAIDEELSAIRSNNTWTLTELPKGKRAINSKWVFKIKYGETGNTCHKARLVVKGCSQRKGFDYSETYAPVARMTTVRILLSIINNQKLIAEQLDVKNAFLHGNLEEEIYMKQPDGSEDGTTKVCKLVKTLYGLKQSPRAWSAEFVKLIKDISLKQSEWCLFYELQSDVRTYLLLYVDDIIISNDDIINQKARINELKGKLGKRFSMKNLGNLQSFLGIRIRRDETGMYLDQSDYTRRLIDRFAMTDCKPCNTPIESKSFTETSNEEDYIIGSKPYKELIGCLMYLMLGTRPDISVSVNYFSRFQENYTESHWRQLKRILRYLKETIDMSIYYPKIRTRGVIAYADADWASDADRKSTTGFMIGVHRAPVSWVD